MSFALSCRSASALILSLSAFLCAASPIVHNVGAPLAVRSAVPEEVAQSGNAQMFPGLDLLNGHMDYNEGLQGHTAHVQSIRIEGTDFSLSSNISTITSGLPIIGNILDLNLNIGGSIPAPDQTPTIRNITVDMKTMQSVTGIEYLPTSDVETNGEHAIRVSLDGKHWSQVIAKGTWSAGLDLKTVSFERQLARFIRLSLPAGSAGGQKSKRDDAAPQYGSGFTVLSAPKPSLPRDDWKVSADSFQGGDQFFTVEEAIDGASTTWWQTPTKQGPNYPHYYIIDTGKAVSVSGFTYLPPPPVDVNKKLANGTIGKWSIEQSSDGKSWVTVENGTFEDNTDVKVVQFKLAFPITERYWKFNALSEAGNRVNYAGASEINLLDGAANTNYGFAVNADSAETGHEAEKAFDTDANSFWITKQDGQFPHTYTIDMAINRNIFGLIYVPRQDGIKDGNIGDHVIDISTDGNTWTKVASGQWEDNALSKDVVWDDREARYVRITATSEAGNRGPWASAGQFSLLFSGGQVPSVAGLGQWSPIIDFPIVPVAVVPLETDKLVTWSAWLPDQYLFSQAGRTYTATYDLKTGTVSERVVTETNHDMFCPGLATDFDGNVVVTGGNSSPRTSVLQPEGEKWLSEPNMTIARGYQAATMVSDGRYFTIGGSWSGTLSQDKTGEILDPNTSAWTPLPGTKVAPMLTKDPQGIYRQDNHAWLFAWSNSTVFQAGPSNAMNWYYVGTAPGDVKPAGTRLASPDSMNGNAVMYDAVAGKIFTAGGALGYQDSVAHASAHLITIKNAGDQAQVEKLPDMHWKRSLANSVVLPDGKVLIIGGQQYAIIFTDDEAVLSPELWDPVTKQFTPLAKMRVPRTYHSTAVLLPDGTVFSGGGGLCGTCATNHFDGQIFSPPYLFTKDGTPAQRPEITSIDKDTFAVGSQMTVASSAPDAEWSLVRKGSSTHSINTDQRRIPLGKAQGGKLNIPADPGIALPGFWYLFAYGSDGVPSVAKVVKITPK